MPRTGRPHLRIGSTIENFSVSIPHPVFPAQQLQGTATNVVVTNIHSAYVEVEYDYTPTDSNYAEYATEGLVRVRPWSSFVVLSD